MHPAGTPGQAVALPQPGQTLGGKYEIVRLLGEGGMASVYEASHRRLEQRVAIKLLAPDFARDPELVKRFEREARAVARLRTRHVARVMDVDSTPNGVPYIVMEFLEGRDLDAELAARTKLPLDEAVDYVLQACAGMIEAHGLGIVHRDLKPANLFLANDPETGDRLVKVLDFGISKVVGEATRLTMAGAVMGTVMYMSPEQVRAQPNVDTRADIWALGVILYELVAGRAPWEGHSHQIAAAIVSRDAPQLTKFVAVPEAFAAAVRTMIQRDPAERFATVRDVIAALAPFAPPGSIGAAVAEQAALAQGPRRPGPASGQTIRKRTVPMASRPGGGPLDVASAAARASTPSASSLTEPVAHSRVPESAGTRSRARLVLLAAIVVGLLGAVGVVLIIVASMRHAPSPAPAADDDATAASASASPPNGASSPTSSAPDPTLSAAPPSTGTAGRSATSADTSPRMTPAVPGNRVTRDAGRSSPTTSAPANPPLL